MENKTIEERARTYTKEVCGCDFCVCRNHYCLCSEYKNTYDTCVQIATEQDKIARQDERKKSIKAAQDIYCESICILRDICKDHGQCSNKNKFREAMKGDEE